MTAWALSGAPLQSNAIENGLPHLINPVSKLLLFLFLVSITMVENWGLFCTHVFQEISNSISFRKGFPLPIARGKKKFLQSIITTRYVILIQFSKWLPWSRNKTYQNFFYFVLLSNIIFYTWTTSVNFMF